MPQILPLAATAMVAAVPAATAAAATTAATATLTSTLVSVASQAAVSMAVSAAMSLLSPKVGAGGRPVDWTLDPNGPIPFAFGRVGVAGAVIHKATFGPDKMFNGFVSVLSGAGPIDGYESYTADDLLVQFDGAGKCTTPEWAGELFRVSNLGTQPATFLATPTGLKNNSTLPNWNSANRVSGKALSMVVMAENSKGTAFPNGEIKPREVFRGQKCWDPRKDSTYPGGSGPQRLNDASTWAWSENPAICAVKWILGLWEDPVGKGVPQVGQQVGGIGSKLSGIDLPAYVAAANICDANGWTCAAYPNTDDDKHEVLLSFLQAAGAIYSQRAGKISLIQRAAPKTSVATITADDVIGAIEIDTASSRIDRINTIVPTYWSPQHRWQNTALPEVTVPAYRTADGGKRSRGITYAYVTNANQASQLAALELQHSREGMAGQVSLKPYLQRILPGDVFTISEPGFLLDGLKCLCMSTEYDPAEAVVRVTFVSETDAKYPFALGQSAVVPTPPTLVAGEPVSPPEPGDWDIVVRPPGEGGGLPGFDLTGLVSNMTAARVLVETGPSADGPWTHAWEGPPTTERIALYVQPNTEYWIAVSYFDAAGRQSERTIGGPFMSGDIIAGGIAPNTPAWDDLRDLIDELLAGGPPGGPGTVTQEAIDAAVAAAEARLAQALADAEDRLEAADAIIRGLVEALNLDDLEGFTAFQINIQTLLDGKASNQDISVLQTQTDNLRGRILSVEETLTDLDGEIASSQSILDLTSEIEGARDGALDLKARLLADRNTVTNGLAGKASAQDLVNLTARVTDTENDVEAQNTRLDTVETDIAGKASATSLSDLTARVTTAEGVNTAQNTRLSTAESNIAGKASSTDLVNLTSRVEDAETDVAAQNLRLNTAESNIAGKASASDLSQLTARVEGVEGINSAQNTRLATAESDIAGKASASTVNTLSATVSGRTKTYTGSNAAGQPQPPGPRVVGDIWIVTNQDNKPYVWTGSAWADASDARVAGLLQTTAQLNANYSSQQQAIANLETGKATVSSVEALGVQVGGYSASITTASNVAAEANGRSKATTGVVLDVNGRASGFASTNNGATSSFDVLADKFTLSAPGGGARTEFSSGNWRIYDGSNVLRVRLGIW